VVEIGTVNGVGAVWCSGDMAGISPIRETFTGVNSLLLRKYWIVM